MKTSKDIPLRAVAPAVEDADHRAWYPLVLIFAILALGILAGGIFSYRNYERHFRTGIEQELSAIADLKVSELAQWRTERLGDGSLFFQNAAFSALVRRLLEKPEDAEAQQQIQTWLERCQTLNRYDQIRLLDIRGVTKMVVPTSNRPALASIVAQSIPEVLRSDRVMFRDFYRNEHDQRIYLAVLVPILDEADTSRPLGALVLRIDPETYLYPFIRLWPTPSRTAETLLVRRDGNDALFLTELKFQTNTALKLRIPLAQTNVIAMKAALGQEGVVEGRDYRGVPVVAALRAIPDSPWSLVARLDTAEVYAPLRERLWLTVLFMSALLLGAGASLGMVWRQQRVHYYRARHEATEALIASEVRYRRLFESAKDGILILDAETGMVVDVNPFLIGLLGFSHEQFLGKKVWELGFFRDMVANQAHFAELQQKEYIRYEDRALETADGRRIEVEFVSNVYPVNHHRVIQCNIRDITERKRAEGILRTFNAELEQRVRERTAQLAAANQQLEAANKELEAFSYSVSHDLRAPLRHVLGYVEMLAQEAGDQLSQEGRRYLKTITDASEEMGVLIDDLLAFSRMGRAEMSETSVELGALVQEALRSLESTTSGRNIVWKIPPLPVVQGDPAMLKQVFTNLLGNAVKYTRPRDPAQIEVACAGHENGRIILFVRDNGVGFDPQYAHKLFGVFQRLHRADQFEGTGIGLANVRRIVARHAGRTWAEGAINEGATFYFTLKPISGPVK